MKGQQLLYSFCFLPGVTAAVLTTQPSVAEEMKVSSVQLASSPSVLTANDSQTLVAGNTQTQLPENTAQVFPDATENADLSEINSDSFKSKKHPVILTENTGIASEQKSPQDEVKIVSQSPNRELIQRLKQNRLTKNQKQSNLASSQPELVKTVVPVTNSFPGLAPAKNLKTQLPIALQASLKGAGAANLLAANSCSLQPGTSATLILATNCPQAHWSRKQLAQNSDPTSETTTPPATVDSAPKPTIAPATTPIPATTTPEVPETLTPKANPLLFPTQTQEVTTQENQPITLTQALEIARRNNRDLQVSLLELERSQAALRDTYYLCPPDDSRRRIHYTVRTDVGHDPVLQKLLDMGFRIETRYDHETETLIENKGTPVGGFPL